MVAAWEFWVLVSLGALQLAVAYRWWEGPSLEGTRGWVAALFALNGVYTVLKLGTQMGFPQFLLDLASMGDKWTNVALVGFGAAALDVGGRRGRLRRAVLLPLATVVVAATAYITVRRFAGLPDPAWHPWVSIQVLGAAILVGAAATAARFARWEDGTNPVWGIALAGVGLRYAELSTWLFPTPVPTAGDLLADPALVARVVALPAMVLAFGVLVLRYVRRRPTRARRTYELALALLLAGFLFGLARRTPDKTVLAIVLTFALARPLAFLEAQARLDGEHIWSHRSGRRLAVGAGGLLAALAGVGLGAAVGLGFEGRAVVGAALVPLGAWGAHALPTVPLGPGPTEAETGGNPGTDWPVEADRVTLPDGWREDLEDAYEDYADQSPEVRDALDGLAYWERLVLALDGAPDREGLPAYERTTPGLHLWTHCQYSGIGSELSRADDRAEVVAEALGVDATGPGTPKGGLVAETWGRAKGLESTRAKIYELTPLGERVAAALREKVGLPEADPQEVARLVPAGFRSVDR